MEKYMVELEGVSKSFPGVKALNKVNFNLKSGEVLALLGENGAGKSTLMKIISGVYKKDEGTLKLFGEEVEDLTPLKAQELGVSIIHQELNLCPHLTVYQNIFLGREETNRGVMSDKKMKKEAAAI